MSDEWRDALADMSEAERDEDCRHVVCRRKGRCMYCGEDFNDERDDDA